MAKEPKAPSIDDPGGTSKLTDTLGRPLADEAAPTRRGFDASDPKQVEAAKREAGDRDRRDADVLRKLMHTVEGRDFLYRRLKSCFIFDQPFAPGAPDITAHNLGRQNFGKELWMQAQRASLDLYLQMMREAIERERKDDAR